MGWAARTWLQHVERRAALPVVEVRGSSAPQLALELQEVVGAWEEQGPA